jgi:hypothetical protein
MLLSVIVTNRMSAAAAGVKDRFSDIGASRQDAVREQRLMLAVVNRCDRRVAEFERFWEPAQTPRLCRSGAIL